MYSLNSEFRDLSVDVEGLRFEIQGVIFKVFKVLRFLRGGWLQCGGRNVVLADSVNRRLPLCSDAANPVILFGADVTHPAAHDEYAQSIASVTSQNLLETLREPSGNFQEPCRVPTGTCWEPAGNLPGTFFVFVGGGVEEWDLR